MMNIRDLFGRPRKLPIPFVLSLNRAQLDFTKPILTLDPNYVRAIILVDITCTYCPLPRSSENKVGIRMVHHEYMLLDLDPTQIDRNIVTHTDRSRCFQFAVGIVRIDAPTNFRIDRKTHAFEYAFRHHIDLRPIV